jgi:hypothetical protein
MLSMSLSLRSYQRLEVSQRLTLIQKLAVKEVLAGLGIELAGALVGVKYKPKNYCPSCNKDLTLAQILNGYAPGEPENLQTRCPYCESKFVANLVSNYINLIWYCPDQTLYALEGKQNLTPAQILAWNPSVYHSAVTHFGSVRNAFFKKGFTNYKHKEILEWEKRVAPFLGRLPDTDIARIVGVCTKKISGMRKKLGVMAFSKRELAETLA